MLFDDTIAAIATAPGRGGVAIVRVSGSGAFALAETLTDVRPAPGRTRFVTIRDTRDHSAIDTGLLLTFRAPHSYTGEDVIEFQCHGGDIVPRRILEVCLANGARLARRGEFTQRALLNGKLDYDQAASVLDLIDAKTNRAAEAALAGLNGRRQRTCRELYARALALSTELEHALDIDTDELPADFTTRVCAQATALRRDLENALVRQREGLLLRRGFTVVLVGPPNAGKSSLMNALLEENRAIVSETPGTTRDFLEEWLDLDGWPIRLIDTAGIRDVRTDSPADKIEAEGIRRAEQLRDAADVILQLGDGPEDDRTILVHAKCDLQRGAGVNVSALTREGLDELKRVLVDRLRSTVESGRAEDASSDGWRLNELAVVFPEWDRIWVASGELDLVLAANVVRTLSEKLGELLGATYSADLLDRLFSRFCVGK